MKIVFICGSLEPGKNGVGDYTRRLAGELLRKGHNASIIALYDKQVKDVEQNFQQDDQTEIPVLRIPAEFKNSLCFLHAREFIDHQNPQWLSLQFVPYSFQNKGLPFNLGKTLAKIGKGKKVHIMFHELWVGINDRKNIKYKIIGNAQKILINGLINRCQPSCITTTIPLYKKQLSNHTVQILPLFGNIPVIKQDFTRNYSSDIKVVHFGSFSGAINEFEKQLKYLKKTAAYYRKGIELLVFGEGGPYKTKALGIARTMLGKDKVLELGSLSAIEISSLLQTADIGVSRSDFGMVGKSGSTLAIIEHGLPVLLRGNKTTDLGIDGRISYEEQLLSCDSDYSKINRKWEAKSMLIEITELFIDYLKERDILLSNDNFVNSISYTE